MESGKRRVGRPKSAARTGPLVLAGNQGREKVEIELTAATAHELAEYVKWVELSAPSMATADATLTTTEYALRELFRRDRVWQQRRREAARQPPSATPPSLPPTASARPMTLPPPNGIR
jgi:hypothetical protein